jgi:predicted dehydrogenase
MQLKLIQVGLGAHGRGVGEHYILNSPDFEYAGLVDLDRAAAEAFATRHNLAKIPIYSDYKQAFTELEADAALIVAASPAHYALCRAALENGLHVLVEKPFVTSLKEGRELVRLAKQRGKNLMVSQNYRYFSSVLTLKKALQSELSGKPQFIQAQFYHNHDPKAYQRVMEDYMLLEMAVHHIDLIRFLLESDIVSAQGMTWNYPDSGYRGDPNVHAIYQTGAGVPVFYTGSLAAKGLSTPWEGHWRVQCTEGALYLDDLGEGYGVYITEPGDVIRKLAAFVPEQESLHGILAEFATSIRENREPVISGRDNLKTLAALFATVRSSREGKTIQVAIED